MEPCPDQIGAVSISRRDLKLLETKTACPERIEGFSLRFPRTNYSELSIEWLVDKPSKEYSLIMKTYFPRTPIDSIQTVRKEKISFTAARQALAALWLFLAPRYLMKRADMGPSAVGLTICDADIRVTDAILLLGSNDLAPVKMAAGLYKKIVRDNPDVVIIASGKGGHLTVPGQPFTVTEAEVYADQLRQEGVPAESIYLERESENTGANIKRSREIMFENDLKCRRIAIVQSPAAQLRANLVFERKWSNGWEYYISCPPQPPDIEAMPRDILIFHLGYALREIATTINYSYNPKYDYQTKKKIPRPIIHMMITYYRRVLKGTKSITERNFFDPENMEHLMRVFRENYEEIERRWIDQG